MKNKKSFEEIMEEKMQKLNKYQEDNPMKSKHNNLEISSLKEEGNKESNNVTDIEKSGLLDNSQCSPFKSNNKSEFYQQRK